MSLQAKTYQSGDGSEIRSLDSKVKSTPIQTEKEVYIHEEVFGDFTLEPFTLKEALEALEITEWEFQERLELKGICPKKDYNRNGEFPVEWIKAVDTHKWILTD